MEGKKSVILYIDVISTFENLDDAEAGRLIKHYLRYVNDLNPESPDKITQIAFEPIKQQLKRDLKSWNNVRSKRSESGHEGGIKSGEIRRKMKETKQNEANEANALKTKQNEANEAVTVNVTVTDTVTEEDIYIPVTFKMTTEQSNKWQKVEGFIKSTMPRLLRFEEPLTPFQYFEMRKTYSGDEIEKVMRALSNTKKIKNMISVYDTTVAWIINNRNKKVEYENR